MKALLVRFLVLATLVAACDGALEDDRVSDTGADTGVDVGADVDPDAAPPCDETTPWCEGSVSRSCEDGRAVSTDCAAAGGYCNFGTCTDSAFALPADAAPHEDPIEWWYYTGHVRDGDREFGFEIALFQQRMADLLGSDAVVDQEFGYMCHVAVLDKTAGTHAYAQGFSLVAASWSSDPVDLDTDNCHIELSGDGHDHIVGRIPAGREGRGKPGSWRFDLQVDTTKPVVHHGTDGVIAMADAGDSFYYSYTRLDAAGTIETPSGTFDVVGQAWMDHQWGGFSTSEFKGWDWWSMQLDDGWEIMLFLFRSWDDVVVVKSGTLVDPDGNTRPLDGLDAFSIESLRTWSSEQTDGVYPLDWNIVIPELDWDLQVRTDVDVQEVPNLAKSYWEGAVTIAGTRGGTPVTGLGYVELTGYASNPLVP